MALLLAGSAIAVPVVTHDSSPEELTAFYVDGSSSAVFTGGYLQCLGLLRFLPFAAGLHRWLRDREPRQAFAASTARMAAVGYVTLSLAPGISAARAAVYRPREALMAADVSQRVRHPAVTDAGMGPRHRACRILVLPIVVPSYRLPKETR